MKFKLLTMNITKKTLLAQVLEEAIHLRENATDEEKGKLDFDALRVSKNDRCIYGQMTGHCDSERAAELYKSKYNSVGTRSAENKGLTTFSELKELNPEGEFEEHVAWFTPIEVYITMKGAKNKSLIRFIKGEIKTFKP